MKIFAIDKFLIVQDKLKIKIDNVIFSSDIRLNGHFMMFI